MLSFVLALSLLGGQQVSVDTSLFKSLFGSSGVVIVNGAPEGSVIPVIDGADLLRDSKVGKKKQTQIAVLAPGESAAVQVRAGNPRSISLAFKYYDTNGKFVGATEPRILRIPGLPQTVEEVITFVPSQLKR